MQNFLKLLLPVLFGWAIACTQNNNAAKAPADPATPAAATVKFDNETDFICEMKVTPEFEDTCHYQGKVYAFCSTSCKETFLEEPEKYLAGK